MKTVKPMKTCHAILAICLLIATAVTTAAAETSERQIVAGAGPATVVAQLFFELLEKKPELKHFQFSVPAESTKHAGGISNSDQYLFGRIGRPLSPQEKSLHKKELFLAKVPFVFTIGSAVGIRELSLAQVESIFLGRVSNWKTFGGPDKQITVVGREATEAFFSALKQHYPNFTASRFDLTLKKDHQVIEYLSSPAGAYAISFGAKPNFLSPNILKVADFAIGVNIGLVYDKKNHSHPVVEAARKFSRTTEWRGGLIMLGLTPADI
jgi:ABC-type phosphate transport system substrate-binding protein